MSPKLTVHFFGFLREVAGCKKVDVEVADGATLGDLLSNLERRFGERFRMAVLDRGGVQDGVVISIDGYIVRDLERPLQDGQVIFITPILVGGAQHSEGMVRCLNCLVRIEVKQGEEMVKCSNCGLEYAISWISPTQPKIRHIVGEGRGKG